jgi:hypothetical protein
MQYNLMVGIWKSTFKHNQWLFLKNKQINW